MKFEIFQCMFWRDRIYLLPTIVIDSGDAQYRCKNLAIEFHFLFWNMRWLWLELEQKPCEDAVSRQTVLNEVRAIATWHSGDAFNEDRVIRHMKMLPSVLPKREQGGWISVKDRLPKRNGFYLAWYTFKDGGHACDMFYYNGSFISSSITHWMSIPKPPKENEE